MFRKKHIAIGIDFGTTKTAIAIYDSSRTSNHIRFIREEGGGEGELDEKFDYFPSIVTVRDPDDKNKIVTRVSRSAEGSKIVSSLFDFTRTKLDIGRLKFEQSLMRGMSIPKELSGVEPWHIAGTILRYSRFLIDSVFDKKTKNHSDGVTITVPATWDPEQRRATILAAQKAGFKNVELLEEPIAALIGIDPDIKTTTRIMVIDFGGGTCDAAIVDYAKDQLEIIATGTTELGGEEIDRLLLDHFIEQHGDELEIYGIDVFDSKNRNAYSALLQIMQKIKQDTNDLILRLENAAKTVLDGFERYLNEKTNAVQTRITKQLRKKCEDYFSQGLRRKSSQDSRWRSYGYFAEDLLDSLIKLALDTFLVDEASNVSPGDKLTDEMKSFFDGMASEIVELVRQNFYEFNLETIEPPIGLSAFSNAGKKMAVFKKAEFDKYLQKFPHAQKILDTHMKYGNDRVYLDTDMISEERGEIGREAFEMIKKNVKEPPRSLTFHLPPKTFKELMTKACAEYNNRSIKGRFQEFVEKMIIDGGGQANIGRLCVVGGSSKLYFVAEVLREFFWKDDEKVYERRKLNIQDPRQQIARGAATYQFKRQQRKKLFDRILSFAINIKTGNGTTTLLDPKKDKTITGAELISRTKEFEISATPTSTSYDRQCTGVKIVIDRENNFDNKPRIEKTLKFDKSVPYGTTMTAKAILRRDGILSIEAKFPLASNQLFNKCIMLEDFPIYEDKETASGKDGIDKRRYDMKRFALESFYPIHRYLSNEGDSYD